MWRTKVRVKGQAQGWVVSTELTGRDPDTDTDVFTTFITEPGAGAAKSVRESLTVERARQVHETFVDDLVADEDAFVDEVRLLTVHPALWRDLVAWLDQRGLDVGRIPDSDVDGLTVYTTTPRFPGE